jgi:integrase
MSPPDERDEYGNKAEEALRDSLEGRKPPGTGSITSTTTLGELLTRYIARCREDGELAPKSVDTYEATVTAVKSRMVGVRVEEATPGRLDVILRGIRRDHGATRERHTKVALNAVLTEAVMVGAITANPVRELGTRRRRKADKKVKGAPVLEADQLRKLLQAVEESEVCASKDLCDPVIVLAGTGMRRGELLALRPEDVDLDNRAVTINGSVVRVKGQGLIRQDWTKGGDVRSVPLPQFAVDALRRRKESFRGPNTAGVIFPSSTGTLRDPDNFGKQWREVRDDLGLPDLPGYVTSHSFRKTVATLLDDAGLSARIAADQLGHAKPSMTMDTYMGRGQEHPEVAAALDNAVKLQSAVEDKSVE